MEGFVSLTPLAIDWTATQTKSALAEHFGS
jgi:hypothetical protein